MTDKIIEIEYQIVELIPKHIDEKILYICKKYEVAVHKCICGCGNKVVTPFSENEWKLTIEDKKVSLTPSIGNRFKCKSHYWIKDNQIIWA